MLLNLYFLLDKWSYEEAEKLLNMLIVVKLQRKRDTKNLVKNYNLKYTKYDKFYHNLKILIINISNEVYHNLIIPLNMLKLLFQIYIKPVWTHLQYT